MEELVAIAKIARHRGLRGEVIADVLTDFPERFEGLENVVAILADGSRADLKIENSWFQKGRVVLKISGVDSVEAAVALRNAEICVPESSVVELQEDEFFDWQLEGCRVETVEGENIGVVRELMKTGGTDNLVIADEDTEYLIPFAEAICREVDLEGKKIVVDLPEGLLDL